MESLIALTLTYNPCFFIVSIHEDYLFMGTVFGLPARAAEFMASHVVYLY